MQNKGLNVVAVVTYLKRVKIKVKVRVKVMIGVRITHKQRGNVGTV